MKDLKTYLLLESNSNLFRETCIKYNGKLLKNKGYLLNGDGVISIIQNTTDIKVHLPNLLSEWLYTSENDELCCVEFNTNQFDKIEKILDSNQFAQIENDSNSDDVDDMSYDVQCIKYEYKNEKDQFVYVVKIDYGIENNRPFKNHQYFVIFNYKFNLK